MATKKTNMTDFVKKWNEIETRGRLSEYERANLGGRTRGEKRDDRLRSRFADQSGDSKNPHHVSFRLFHIHLKGFAQEVSRSLGEAPSPSGGFAQKVVNVGDQALSRRERVPRSGG